MEEAVTIPIQNSEIARMFSEMADVLDVKGANQFRVGAYRNASGTINGLSKRVADVLDDDGERGLTDLPNIGEDLAKKIHEIVESGEFPELEEEKESVPNGLTDLLKVHGLGPNRVRKLYNELGVENTYDLKKAAEEKKVRTVKGFGAKTEANLLEELESKENDSERVLLREAQQMAESIVAYLDKDSDTKDVSVAGSFRRGKESVGDLDFVVASEEEESTTGYFMKYEDIDEVVSQGNTSSSVILRSGVQADLRVVPLESMGAAMMYFTGSKAHNVSLRALGRQSGLTVNEYGVFNRDGDRIAGITEEEVYDSLGLDYIPPELREDLGEIDKARDGRLPTLVTVEDIRGDLQAHSTASDGAATVKEMAKAAKDLGYDYIAITDHSKNVRVASGLDEDELKEHFQRIDRINDELDEFRILKSVEVDILKDGSLDIDDEVLELADLTVCSIHSAFDLGSEEQTERILRAMDNPHFNILGHPTGRLINQRGPYQLDMETVMEAALERGCFLEINAQPTRLDLSDRHAKLAKDMGLKLSISTDAHGADGLRNMWFGVKTARRAWLEPEDCLNTRPWTELRDILER